MMEMEYLVLCVIALFTLVLSGAIGQQIEYRKAGETVVFRYLRPSNKSSCGYVLSFNNQSFFANGHHVHSGGRGFQVDLGNGHIPTVSVTLQPLQPEDAGTFRCTYVCSHGNHSTENTLRVYHPPERAECWWASDGANSSPPRHILRCIATNGNPGDGEIVCFSKRTEDCRMARHNATSARVTSRNVIRTRFEFNSPEYEIACCSVSSIFIKGQEECRDFVFPAVPTTAASPSKTIPFTTSNFTNYSNGTFLNETFNNETFGNVTDVKAEKSQDIMYFVYIWVPILALITVAVMIASKCSDSGKQQQQQLPEQKPKENGVSKPENNYVQCERNKNNNAEPTLIEMEIG